MYTGGSPMHFSCTGSGVYTDLFFIATHEKCSRHCCHKPLFDCGSLKVADLLTSADWQKLWFHFARVFGFFFKPLFTCIRSFVGPGSLSNSSSLQTIFLVKARPFDVQRSSVVKVRMFCLLCTRPRATYKWPCEKGLFRKSTTQLCKVVPCDPLYVEA